MNALSTALSGLCNPRNNLSLGSLKTNSVEVRFKEKSKLVYKLIRLHLAVEAPHLFD